jgi:hypothetical protein
LQSALRLYRGGGKILGGHRGAIMPGALDTRNLRSIKHNI